MDRTSTWLRFVERLQPNSSNIATPEPVISGPGDYPMFRVYRQPTGRCDEKGSYRSFLCLFCPVCGIRETVFLDLLWWCFKRDLNGH